MYIFYEKSFIAQGPEKVLLQYTNTVFTLTIRACELLAISSLVFVCLIWLFTSQSTAMVMSRRSDHLTAFCPWASLTERLTSTSCT